MSLLMYAVTEAPAGEVRGTGLHGARLEAVQERGLVAIVSEGERSSIEVNDEALLEYERAVERLMEGRVILPARFASILADENSTRELLARRRDELTSALDRVRGAVEFAISAHWRNVGEVSGSELPESGTEYLLRRLERHRRASDVARRLDPLAVLARNARLRILPRPALAMTGSYLVEETRAEEFVQCVARVDALVQDAEVICTGPWPPYSFVEAVPG